MPDIRTNLIWTLRDEVSAGTQKLKGELDGMGVKAKGATGILGGLGNVTGGLVNPTSLAAAGVFAFGAILGESVKAAIDEEKSLAQLDASLKANIPNWNGNTDAIEKTIKANEKFAFSDDDLRSSLAKLVGATHDVKKAQDLQSAAMDLARFKNISLGDATEALTKVEAGSFRILKSLGIVLKAGATQTEALAAVQAVAGGQAKAYGDTTAGAMESVQIAVHDLSEDIGKVLLPIVKELAVWARDEAVPALSDLIRTVKDAKPVFDALGTGGNSLIPILDKNRQSIDDLNRAYNDIVRGGYTKAMVANDELARSERTTTQATIGIGFEARKAADILGVSFDEMMKASAKLRDSMLADKLAIVTGYYDALITQDKLRDAQAEVSANKRILASATATAAEKHDAREALHQLGADQAKYLIDLATAGKTGSAVFSAGMLDLLTRLKSAHGDEQVAILAEIDALDALIRKAKYGVAVVSGLSALHPDSSSPGKGLQARADGGPVTAGMPYIVGERRAEVFVPDMNGTIQPSTGGGMGGSTGGNMTLNIHPGAIVVSGAQDPQATARELMLAIKRELTRQGTSFSSGY